MQIRPDFPPLCRRLLALADRDPRRAIPLARRALATTAAGDSLAHAWAAYALGWALLCWERIDEARALLGRARERFADAQDQHGALRCRFAELLADKVQPTLPDLPAQFAALADQFDQADLPIEAARVRLELARYLVIMRRAGDAEALLGQIAATLERGDPLDQAQLLCVRGIVANARSQYLHADALLAEAERGFARMGNRREQARCWMEQAWVALRREDLERALATYQRTGRAAERLDLPLLHAFCARDSGYLLSMRGDYDLALQQIFSALRTFQTYRRNADQGGCHLHIGNIYFYTGRWDAALACYIRAEAMYAEAGVVGLGLIAQRNRAMVYRAQGRRADARALLAAVEPRAAAAGNQAEVAEIWGIQAALLADDAQYDAALARYRQAQDLFNAIDHLPGAAECLLEQGWLELRRGAPDLAEERLRAASAPLNRHPHHRWRADYGLARCAAERGAPGAALGLYRSASATVSGLRRRLASEEISSSLYTQAAQLHIDALRLAAGQGSAEILIEISEYQRALVLRRALTRRLAPLEADAQVEHERLRRRIVALLALPAEVRAARAAVLDATLAEYGELLLHAQHRLPPEVDAATAAPDDGFDLADVRARLSAAYAGDWTALVYTVNEDALLIACVTPERVDLTQTPFDADLRQRLAQASKPRYRQYTYRDFAYRQGRAARPWDGLRALAERLIPPAARARLHPAHRLLIIPADALNSVAWAALRLDQGWLVENAILQIAPSLSAWRALSERGPAQSAEALFVGCSAFGGRAPALPEVAAELRAVAEHWPGKCDRLLDAQATRTALLARSGRGDLEPYGLVHIASHAQLLSTWGLAAHIKLWDGDVLLPEVAGLRLGGGLVTLSSCDGAAADALPGEEVLSLSWAFLAAGARAVLASLWPVYDTVAPRFMELFYAALRRSGDAALALSLAQRSAIEGYAADDVLLAEPLCWSNFVLTGGPLAMR